MAWNDTLRELLVKVRVMSNAAEFLVVEDRLQSIREVANGFAAAMSYTASAMQELLKSGATLEAMQIKFGVLTKDAELGAKLIEDLNQFAAVTPFTLKEVRKNTSMLIAMGIETEDVIDTMRMLGEVTAGLPNLSLERLALNFGQVKSQAYLTGRELRDFAVGGVPLLEALSENLGISEQEIRNRISRKEISFEQTLDAFKYMTGESGRFYRLLDRMANTSQGLYNNVLVTWGIVKENVGKNLVEQVKPYLIAFKDFFSENRVELTKRLTKAVSSLVKILIIAHRVVFTLAQKFIPVAEVLSSIIVGIIDLTFALYTLITESRTIMTILRHLIVLFALLNVLYTAGKIHIYLLAITKMKTVFAAIKVLITKSLIPAIKAMGVAIAAFAKKAFLTMLPVLKPVLLLLAAILLLEDAYVFLWGLATGNATETAIGMAIEQYFGKNIALVNTIKDMLLLTMGGIITIIALFGAFWQWITGEKGFMEALLDNELFMMFVEKFNEVIRIAAKAIWYWIKGLAKDLWTWVESIGAAIDEWGDELDRKVYNYIKNIAKYMKDIIEPIIKPIYDFFDSVFSSIFKGFVYVYNRIAKYIPGLEQINLNIVDAQKRGSASRAFGNIQETHSLTNNNQNIEYNDQKVIHIHNPSESVMDKYFPKQTQNKVEFNMLQGIGD